MGGISEDEWSEQAAYRARLCWAAMLAAATHKESAVMSVLKALAADM